MTDTDTERDEERGFHPTSGQYVEIGVILAVVTAVEIALFFAGLDRAIVIPALIVLTIIKFLLVVMWFMHLRFDHRLFTRLFTSGLVLAGILFAIMIVITVF